MKIYFEKQKGALYPVNDSDKESLTKIKNGSVFMKDFKLVRNPIFHRLVFSFLSDVFQFQDQFDDFELFRKRMKWYSGSYDEYMIDGKMIIELHSWKFEKMKELEFQDLYKRLKNAAWNHYVHNTIDQQEIIRRQNILLPYD